MSCPQLFVLFASQKKRNASRFYGSFNIQCTDRKAYLIALDLVTCCLLYPRVCPRVLRASLACIGLRWFPCGFGRGWAMGKPSCVIRPIAICLAWKARLSCRLRGLIWAVKPGHARVCKILPGFVRLPNSLAEVGGENLLKALLLLTTIRRSSCLRCGRRGYLPDGFQRVVGFGVGTLRLVWLVCGRGYLGWLSCIVGLVLRHPLSCNR